MRVHAIRCLYALAFSLAATSIVLRSPCGEQYCLGTCLGQLIGQHEAIALRTSQVVV
jgi:hypothetical protein